MLGTEEHPGLLARHSSQCHETASIDSAVDVIDAHYHDHSTNMPGGCWSHLSKDAHMTWDTLSAGDKKIILGLAQEPDMTKSVLIPVHQAIADWPHVNLPSLFVYRHGIMKKQLVRLPHNTSSEELHDLLQPLILAGFLLTLSSTCSLLQHSTQGCRLVWYLRSTLSLHFRHLMYINVLGKIDGEACHILVYSLELLLTLVPKSMIFSVSRRDGHSNQCRGQDGTPPQDLSSLHRPGSAA